MSQSPEEAYAVGNLVRDLVEGLGYNWNFNNVNKIEINGNHDLVITLIDRSEDGHVIRVGNEIRTHTELRHWYSDGGAYGRTHDGDPGEKQGPITPE